MPSPLRSSLHALLLGGASLSLLACGPEPLPPDQKPFPAWNEATVELVDAPSARYDSATGKTTLVVQFIARSQPTDGDATDAVPLGPDEVEVKMRVDGKALDNESILQSGAEELSSSLAYGMVLDASYSMLQHSPPAFEPMKQAAKHSIERGVELFAKSRGTFTPVVSWFDEYVYTQEGPWKPEDVLSIPAPKEGTATRLYAAVDAMTKRMAAMRSQGTAAGQRDRHMMVVFSDGADNLSWFDNASFTQIHTTSTGAPYTQKGSAPVSLEAMLENVRAQPGLTVHVIGLGSSVNEQELKALAEAGRGLYFSNPSSSQIDEVFDRVTREFATVQTVGATVPIAPGQYAFEIEVVPRNGAKAAVCRLTFTAGEGATIDSACAQ